MLPHRQRLVALGRRSQQVLVLAGATGVLVGLAVAAFERLTAEVLLEAVLDAPLWVQACAPAAGLLAGVACLRWIAGGATASTSDEYIRDFHRREPDGGFAPRVLIGRLLASVCTLGSGSPLGYEGPALYGGAGIGAGLHRRLRRFFPPDEAKVLLVAGAAAGVSAIFKAPVTGLVFALEVPYQDDLARRLLLPAAIGSATSYVTFAALAGTDPILPVAGQPPFNLVDLGGAAIVGIAAGLLARLFILLVQRGKAFAASGHPVVRALCGGVLLGASVLAADALDDAELALGPGYHALTWALAPEHSLLAIAALGTLRVVGTVGAIGGGGTGGLFIPLVIQGALVGRVVGGAIESETTSLFPVIGMAAFLGAGYRVPLAAVVFVAEFTGRPGFVVPGLIAAVVSQLVMGRASISPYQVSGRVGHLEARLRLPLRVVVDTEARTAPPDANVEEVFWQHLVAARQQSVIVVDPDGGAVLGIVTAAAIGTVDRGTWSSVLARDVMRTDVPVAPLAWTLQDALRAMDAAGADRLAVVDEDGTFVGAVTAAGIVQLDELLDRVGPEDAGTGATGGGA